MRQFAAIALALLTSVCHAQVDQAALELLRSNSADPTEMAQAWRTVSDANVEAIPVLLGALDDADAVAVNWIGSAIDRIIERTDKAPSSDSLREFILSSQHGNRGRLIALELFQESNPDGAAELIAQLLDDPVPELRGLAVDALLATVDAETDEVTRRSVYQRAFRHARDDEQTTSVAKLLRELGEEVDLVEKHGYLMHWRMVGPFDGAGGDGFDVVYPPELLNLDNYLGEAGIQSNVEYPGKSGAIGWRDAVSSSRHGTLDLNKALGELRGAVAYGAAVYDSAKDQDVQIRLRQQNAFKLWLNGELLVAQPIGHTGNSFDQYTVSARVVAGPNLIVVKSCQPADVVDHPFLKVWQIGGVRVCDPTGAAILAKNRLPTPELDQATSDPTM